MERTNTMRRDRSMLGALVLPFLALGGMALVAPGGPVPGPGDGAQAASVAPAAKAVRVGVFDSRGIAIAFAHSKFNTVPKELMDEYKKAEAAGDKKRMEELKAKGEKLQDHFHRQGFGREPVDDLLAHVKARFPEVCKAAGVEVIVSGVVYADPSVERIDVTDRLVQLYEPSEKVLRMIPELKKHPPLDWDKFPIND